MKIILEVFVAIIPMLCFSKSYTYIDGLSLTMCMFMERCMESGIPVRIYGKKSNEKGCVALGIEYGGKYAKNAKCKGS